MDSTRSLDVGFRNTKPSYGTCNKFHVIKGNSPHSRNGFAGALHRRPDQTLIRPGRRARAGLGGFRTRAGNVSMVSETHAAGRRTNHRVQAEVRLRRNGWCAIAPLCPGSARPEITHRRPRQGEKARRSVRPFRRSAVRTCDPAARSPRAPTTGDRSSSLGPSWRAARRACAPRRTRLRPRRSPSCGIRLSIDASGWRSILRRSISPTMPQPGQ